MENNTVRFLKKRELNKFLNIVKKNYTLDHILGKSKKIVNFYYNFLGRNNTYLIGLFKKKKLISVIGVIPNKNWDSSISSDYFIAFWVKKKNIKINSIQLLNFIFKKIKPKFLATTGINTDTSGKIFAKFGKIIDFNNYFIKNDSMKEKISKNLKNNCFLKNKKKLSLTVNYKLKNKHIIKSKYYPKKTIKYFNNKYLQNPFYRYFSIDFYHNDKLKFFFICREIEVKKLKTRVLRIVDFFGTVDSNFSIFDSMRDFIKKKKYEYIDFICHGLDEELVNIGFTKKNQNQFIPNRFEPFINKEVRNNFCILKNKYKKVLIVKGDGDFDRPNLI